MCFAICLQTSVPAIAAATATEAVPVNCCADLTRTIAEERTPSVDFDITATVAVALPGREPRFLLSDSSGDAVILGSGIFRMGLPDAGDVVRICGTASSSSLRRTITFRKTEILRHGIAPAPVEMTAAQIIKKDNSRLFVRTSATIQDIFRDEIDPDFTFLTLISDGEVLYAALRDCGIDSLDRTALIGARVKITGVKPVAPPPSSGFHTGETHRHLGVILDIPSPDDILVVSRTSSDPYDVPPIDELLDERPSDIPKLGKRSVAGTVLATWRENSLLLRTPRGGVSRIDLSQGPLPRPGEDIEAVGFPSSDLFNINLIRAIWRPASIPRPFPESAVTNTSAGEIALDNRGRTRFKPSFHGRLVRLNGIITRQQTPIGTIELADAEKKDFRFSVDLSTLPGSASELTEGCLVSVTGICVLDITDWRPNDVFPRIKGFKIVPRNLDDIRILSCPPWWTPRRFAIALAVALTVLLFSAVINLILRKLVRRRERELKDEIVAHVETELKIQERTRLAIELHDSISQNLTGVALELRTIDNSDTAIPTTIRHHLDVAERTLESCRDELRYCLWDLRNDTLEQDDVGEAIRRTLKPHIGQALLTVRFNVARDILTDNTTHTIFRTIRELATNAVRHGHASTIRVAGCIEGDNLLFSVTDNGCGFDADNCPGVEEGHYGLLGVRERIESAGGIFTIVSGPNGTKATAALPTHERTIS